MTDQFMRDRNEHFAGVMPSDNTRPAASIQGFFTLSNPFPVIHERAIVFSTPRIPGRVFFTIEFRPSGNPDALKSTRSLYQPSPRIAQAQSRPGQWTFLLRMP